MCMFIFMPLFKEENGGPGCFKVVPVCEYGPHIRGKRVAVIQPNGKKRLLLCPVLSEEPELVWCRSQTTG